jgi:mono/diheme cytochrome c family protein
MICFFNNCQTANTSSVGKDTRLQATPLVAYGANIFEREQCGNCHTLNIANKTTKLISLDGLGGKYGNAWLYHYLKYPSSVISTSKKTPYKHLYARALNKQEVFGTNAQSIADSLWVQLIKEANIIRQGLQRENIKSANTEILALIAFLQKIPSSKHKLARDSATSAKEVGKQPAWNELIRDTSSILMQTAQNTANKVKGKRLFQSTCSPCHGMQGQGGIGPNLTDEYWLHGGSQQSVARTIAFGVPAKGMIAWKKQLTPTQVGELVAFIFSIKGSQPKNAKAPQGKKN